MILNVLKIAEAMTPVQDVVLPRSPPHIGLNRIERDEDTAQS
jgi:hypothetical protein